MLKKFFSAIAFALGVLFLVLLNFYFWNENSKTVKKNIILEEKVSKKILKSEEQKKINEELYIQVNILEKSGGVGLLDNKARSEYEMVKKGEILDETPTSNK